MSANDINDDYGAGGGRVMDDAEPIDLGAECDWTVPSRLGDLLPRALERLRARAEGDEKPVPMPKPLAEVAETLRGGLWPGVHVMVGNPGDGKSALAMQMALHAAEVGHPVAFIGLELDYVQVVARLLGIKGGVPWSDLYQPHRNRDALRLVRERDAAKEVADLSLYVHSQDPMGWDYHRLYADVRSVREQHQSQGGDDLLPLVVVDYLQIVGSADPREDLRQRVGGAAYQAAMVANELNAAVVLISSTARDNYALLDRKIRKGSYNKVEFGEDDAKALLGVGKESGEIEFAASTVMALCRGENDTRWLGIAKMRTGQTGWLVLEFDGLRGEFTARLQTADDLPSNDEEKEQKNGGKKGAKVDARTRRNCVV